MSNRFTIGNSLESAQACKRIMSSLLNIERDQSILDVGCGTGDDVISLAELVGNRGHATGVDSSEKMITEARKRLELRRREKPLPVEFHQGNVHHLDFADNTFDRIRAERLLMHVDDPRKATAEMVRVTRSGGRIVVFDLDWDGVIINHNDRVLTRKIVHVMCDSIRNGWIGRQLPALFKEAGLRNISTVPHTIVPYYTFFTKVCDGMTKSALQKGAITDDQKLLGKEKPRGRLSCCHTWIHSIWTETLTRTSRHFQIYPLPHRYVFLNI